MTLKKLNKLFLKHRFLSEQSFMAYTVLIYIFLCIGFTNFTGITLSAITFIYTIVYFTLSLDWIVRDLWENSVEFTKLTEYSWECLEGLYFIIILSMERVFEYMRQIRYLRKENKQGTERWVKITLLKKKFVDYNERKMNLKWTI